MTFSDIQPIIWEKFLKIKANKRVGSAYLFSGSGLFIWISNYVIPVEEKFLMENFGDEYERYSKLVKKWLFF